MTLLSYESIDIADNGDPLVDLGSYPFIRDPVYFRKGWTVTPKMYLRRGVADKLDTLQKKHLAAKNLRFCIRDGYRPRSVQAAIYYHYLAEIGRKNPQWDAAAIATETQKFVTLPDNPARIPPHATGGAVDIAIYHDNGIEMDMGTAFDYFGVEAAPDYYETQGNNTAIRDNRRFLFDMMRSENFAIDPDEWWHFDFGNQKWALTTNAPMAFYGEIIS